MPFDFTHICYPVTLGPLKVLATSTDNHPVICYADNEALDNAKVSCLVLCCANLELAFSVVGLYLIVDLLSCTFNGMKLVLLDVSYLFFFVGAGVVNCCCLLLFVFYLF